jgi:hypothetical protein
MRKLVIIGAILLILAAIGTPTGLLIKEKIQDGDSSKIRNVEAALMRDYGSGTTLFSVTEPEDIYLLIIERDGNPGRMRCLELYLDGILVELKAVPIRQEEPQKEQGEQEE